MNIRSLPLILIIFGLLLTALLTQKGDIAWMTMPFLAYLAIAILQSPLVGKINLQATRYIEKTSLGEITSVQVRVTVCNRGAETLHLCLADPLQPGMSVKDGRMQKSAALQAGESTRLQYTFQALRGSFAWEKIRVVISDPLGLIEARLDLPVPAEVESQPVLKKFRSFPLRPQRTLHSAGPVPAHLAGSGTNFWGVREYHAGDPLRRLDWRRKARHPEQFFTKEFEQEEIADIGLVLDARQKTDVKVGEDSLFENSVRATASLADVFLHQGNRVSLLIYGKHSVSLFPGYGKVQLNRILHALSQASTEADDGLDSLQLIPVNMFSSHSLILVLSPLMGGDWRLFPRLRAYGHQVLLISPDPLDYVRGTLPADPTTKLAFRLVEVERRLEIGRITQLWIPVIDWQVSQPLAPLVRTALRHGHVQNER